MKLTRRIPSGSLIICCLLMLTTSGCSLNRSFFHMDSNSPMPFFGFELLPRKSASTIKPESVQHLVSNRTTGHPVADRKSRATPVGQAREDAPHRKPTRLQLRTLSEFLKSNEEDVSLIVPVTPFQP